MLESSPVDAKSPSKERELYVSEIPGAPEDSSEEHVDPAESSKDRHQKIRQIDDFVSGKRQYVEVHECALSVL